MHRQEVEELGDQRKNNSQGRSGGRLRNRETPTGTTAHPAGGRQEWSRALTKQPALRAPEKKRKGDRDGRNKSPLPTPEQASVGRRPKEDTPHRPDKKEKRTGISGAHSGRQKLPT
jgi:hypothetical protein